MDELIKALLRLERLETDLDAVKQQLRTMGPMLPNHSWRFEKVEQQVEGNERWERSVNDRLDKLEDK